MTIDVDNLLAKSATVPKVGPSGGRDIQEVDALAGSLDVQLKVEEDEPDRLRPLNEDRPVTEGVRVVLARIARARHIPMVIERNRRRIRTLLLHLRLCTQNWHIH